MPNPIAALVMLLALLPAPIAYAAEGTPIPGQPYERHETTDPLGRAITYYLSDAPDDTSDPLPLLVYVQGSGCGSHFAEIRGLIASTTGHSMIERAARGRARTLLVEKPGVAYLDAPASPGSAEEATDEFKREHTLDRWATAVVAAIRAAHQRDDIDASRTLVIGHSEGGISAARIAAIEPAVTHVGVFAGGGPTQLFSLLRLVREGHFGNPDATPDQRVASLLASHARVLEDPDSPDAMFFGHPHRRWSTFLTTSPAEQLKQSGASVLIVQGLEDTAVDPASAEVLYAELLAHGKDVELMLIPGADHSLNITENGEIVGSAFQTAAERALDRFESD